VIPFFLPAYSPGILSIFYYFFFFFYYYFIFNPKNSTIDLNPIELFFSWLKQKFRTFDEVIATLNEIALHEWIAIFCLSLPPMFCYNSFFHCHSVFI